MRTFTPTPEVEKVKLLLTNFQDIFSKGSHNCFSEIKHTINTGELKPVKHLMQRTPIGFEKEEEENLKQMLKTGVIILYRLGFCSGTGEEKRWDGKILY